ncbi:MAG: sigma-70 family RNA polymerase sigma factor [Candidatus Aminicenantes bacterium]|nr:sigma-70 family RNA polymerase sigma factor [Candidatus Aminicenantes bacterium]
MSMDENSWIERVLQGDAAAFENLVCRYQARLVAFLWNLLGSGEDARDAAQDVFIHAYSRLGRFDRSRSFRNWLFTIAYNRGIDLLRRKRLFHRYGQRQARGGAAAVHAAPEGIEESAIWQPALRKVTPQERSVLTLKYNEDWGTEEIAAMLGCAPATVRVHLLNARRKLKKELAASGFVPGVKTVSAEEIP